MRESITGSQSSRRAFIAGLAVLPFGLAGCSFLRPADAPEPSAADDGAFPVSIASSFGSIMLKTVPRRIIALGVGSSDACLALGVSPLAMSYAGSKSNGSSPWYDTEMNLQGLSLPAILDESRGVPIDQITALEPDLIVAVNSKIAADDYKKLSAIAPVLAPPGKSSNTDWRTSLKLTAQALGRTSAVEGLIKDIDESMSKALSSYTDLKGTDFIFFKASAAPGATFNVYGTNSNPVRILEEFGLRLAPIVSQSVAEGAAVDTISGPEIYQWPTKTSAALKSQIAVISALSSDTTVITDRGLLGNVPAYKAKTAVMVSSSDTGLALETASILSMKWLIRMLIPEVARVSYAAKKSS